MLIITQTCMCVIVNVFTRTECRLYNVIVSLDVWYYNTHLIKTHRMCIIVAEDIAKYWKTQPEVSRITTRHLEGTHSYNGGDSNKNITALEVIEAAWHKTPPVLSQQHRDVPAVIYRCVQNTHMKVIRTPPDEIMGAYGEDCDSIYHCLVNLWSCLKNMREVPRTLPWRYLEEIYAGLRSLLSVHYDFVE